MPLTDIQILTSGVGRNSQGFWCRISSRILSIVELPPCFFMSSMAPAVWYRLGSPLGSALPRCCPEDLEEEDELLAGAAAAAAAAESSSGSSVGDLLRWSARVSQLSPVGDPGIPAERKSQRERRDQEKCRKIEKSSIISHLSSFSSLPSSSPLKKPFIANVW